jgi:lantibiotic biosynthesis protein
VSKIIQNSTSSYYVEDRIHATINNVVSHMTYDQFGLLNGCSGSLLLTNQYSRYFSDLPFGAGDLFTTITSNHITSNDLTFSSGIAGNSWLFRHFHRNNMITTSELELLCHRDCILLKPTLKELRLGNFDFLYGAIGAAHYFLYDFSDSYREFFEIFFKELVNLLGENTPLGMFKMYDLVNKRVNDNIVELGLAHGLASILKFCLECIKNNICSPSAEYIARIIIKYLIINAKKSGNSYFPTFIENNNNNIYHHRLAWCQGDLGIAFILYQAGTILKETNILNLSLDILNDTTRRKSPKRTTIRDASVCHGTAGAAHIYNKMWHYTNDVVFKRARDYWILKTLNYGTCDNNKIIYKNHLNEVDKNGSGILFGPIGICLVLLSYLTGDLSWDYCIMLND